jgi:hypothetical protein
MTAEQYSALILVMPQIEQLLSQKGVSVPRPSFDGEAALVESDENDEEPSKKANVEATSDEEE